MITRIFFHNDIDGIFSTAIYANISECLKGIDYSLHPVATSMRGPQFNALIKRYCEKDQIIILDYQYHPEAALWIDHHQNEEMGYDPIHNSKIIYDHRAKSAAGLVKRFFTQFGAVPKYVTELADSADMVDSANYPSIDYIFTSKDPVMKLNAFLSASFPSDMIYSRIVEILERCGLNLDKALYLLNIDGSYVENSYYKALKIKDRLQIFGNVTVVMVKYYYQFPRYAENLIAPSVKYNIRVCDESKTEYKISMGFNKWSGCSNPFNIGRFLAANKLSRRGGGHYNVGSTYIDKKDLDDFIELLCETVNEEEDMEKYGVDRENDPVEKKAEELVKTGEVKNIQKAREKAVKDGGQKPEDELPH
jgi:hypothetical protein